jgi:hypothetical protein
MFQASETPRVAHGAPERQRGKGQGIMTEGSAAAEPIRTIQDRLSRDDKTSVEILGIALQGLQQAERSFSKAAAKLASPAAVSAAPPTDRVDLSRNMLELMDARRQYAANLAVEKTAAEMERRTIDILA